MGQQESKPEDIVAVANTPVNYSPPLGPPVRVRSRAHASLGPLLLLVARAPRARSEPREASVF
jgi:hypothetical protein